MKENNSKNIIWLDIVGEWPAFRLLLSHSLAMLKISFLIVAFLLVLLVVSCSTDSGGDQPGTVVVQAPITAPEASTILPTDPPTVAVPTPTPTAVTPPAPLAALVNGQYVFLADYEQQVAQYEQALVEQGLDPDSEQGRADLVLMRQEVLESLIDYALIDQGGAALGVSLSDEELEAQVEADIAAGGGEAAFDEWLQVTGQSHQSFEEMLRASLISLRVLETVAADVPTVAEQVRTRQIVADSEEEAQQILALLQEGTDFVDLARERSVDVTTKDAGGDMGWFPRGWVAPELERAAFALQAGEISDVIRVGDGYHIVQVVERDAAHPLTPEAYMDLKLAVFERWLEDQRMAAEIERFVGE
jgi:foldase protein PrsA